MHCLNGVWLLLTHPVAILVVKLAYIGNVTVVVCVLISDTFVWSDAGLQQI